MTSGRPNLNVPRGVSTCLLALAAVFAGAGCASRYTTQTHFVAPGFTRGALRGQTVAVLPVSPAPQAAARGASAQGDELDGIARGIREAGARVRVVAPEGGAADASADAGAMAEVARRAGVDAAYLLVVRLTDADVYRSYAPRRDRGAGADAAVASRTSGRRVGLRLALLRLPDARPVWLAAGTGDVWQTRAGSAAAPPGASIPLSLEEDLRGGHESLYPPPPPPQVVSRRLTRRLLADLPWATELEPN